MEQVESSHARLAARESAEGGLLVFVFVVVALYWGFPRERNWVGAFGVVDMARATTYGGCLPRGRETRSRSLSGGVLQTREWCRDDLRFPYQVYCYQKMI